MNISHPLSFTANLIALIALACKTFYDLIWNPRRFTSQLATMADLEAARRKRDRADRSTAITFLFLAISYAVLILEALICENIRILVR